MTPYTVFDFYMERFSKYYSWKVVSVNALLTYLSFGVFWTHPQAAQRGQFSITLYVTP